MQLFMEMQIEFIIYFLGILHSQIFNHLINDSFHILFMFVLRLFVHLH